MENKKKTIGQKASTTGTIYGIYDMNGGAAEYVMGVYKPNPIPTTGINDWSGFSSTSTNSQYDLFTIDTKYYNIYTTESDYVESPLQHAMSETTEWYSGSAVFMNGNYSWVLRGYSYLSSSYVGLFGFNRDNGSGNVINNYTFRSTLVK